MKMRKHTPGPWRLAVAPSLLRELRTVHDYAFDGYHKAGELPLLCDSCKAIVEAESELKKLRKRIQ